MEHIPIIKVRTNKINIIYERVSATATSDPFILIFIRRSCQAQTDWRLEIGEWSIEKGPFLTIYVHGNNVV